LADDFKGNYIGVSMSEESRTRNLTHFEWDEGRNRSGQGGLRYLQNFRNRRCILKGVSSPKFLYYGNAI
jgi:hypothetical protein